MYLPKVRSMQRELSTPGPIGTMALCWIPGSQKPIICMGGWEIIKHHDIWIDSQGVNMGGPSKAGFRLQLVDAMGVANIVWIESAT